MVAIAEVRDKLLTLDQVRENLSATEPLHSQLISNEDKILFRYDADWASALEHVQDTDVVGAFIRLNGTEHQLTKAAALSASSAFGIQSTYVKKLPASLLEPQMNYWYNAGMGDKAFSLLTVGNNDRIAAFSKPTISPFSNAQLLDAVLDAISDRYGDGEVFADYKFRHDLNQTDIRLVVPEYERTIVGTAVEGDAWSAGVHLTNSLTGTTSTSLDAYMFRYWCTNGCTETNKEIGTWNRRTMGQDDGVYEWARRTVDEIFESMDTRLDAVQALTDLTIPALEAGNVVAEIFNTYEVPVSQRPGIIDNLSSADTLSLYEVVNAITQVANDPELKPERADRLMRTGGAVLTRVFDPLKARVWREGHTATSDRNPYELGSVPTA